MTLGSFSSRTSEPYLNMEIIVPASLGLRDRCSRRRVPCQSPVAHRLGCHLRTITCPFSVALRVEVEQPSHQTAREGSSSECSSSSPSPMGVQAREESSDSAEENDRRKGAWCGCHGAASALNLWNCADLSVSMSRCGDALRGPR